MTDLRTRACALDDAAAVAALLNQVEEHAGGHPYLTDDDVRTALSALVRDATTDTRVVVTNDGEVVGVAMTPAPPDGGFRADLFGGVHPRWRGRGIGRDLMRWQLDRVAEMRRAQAPDAAWEAHADTLMGDEEAQRLFRRFGLSPARYWFEMVAPIGDERIANRQAADLPPGLDAVGYSIEHEKVLYEGHTDAFSDHWGYQRRDLDTWLALTVRSEGFLPDLSLLAFDGPQLAGYVLSYADPEPSRFTVGHVGVRRLWRRRGIAGGLLAKVLAAAAQAGKSTAALGVDADSPTGAVGVYERVGFTVEQRAVTYSIPVKD